MTFSVKIGEPIREVIVTPTTLPIPGPMPTIAPPTPVEVPV